MTNILKRIVATKADHITALKQRFGEQLSPQKSIYSLYQALTDKPTGFILECKKASPSKGMIREQFDVKQIANTYRHYASAISVLTDEHFFQGNMDYISQVRQMVEMPILCKDFIIDPYQIKLAAHLGADAVLLMLSVLNDQEYQTLALIAAEYDIDILTEVSNQDELKRALQLKAAIIGINNRNLRDLSIELETTENLAPQIPADTLIISESGIYQHQDVRRLAPLVNGFLVGSSLMAQADLDLACRELIYGNNKVCGLTKIKDLGLAAAQGAVYGGLIFAPNSKRQVSLESSKQLASANTNNEHKLKLVGVFVNQTPQLIAEYATTLGLYAVQLHGQETDEDIKQLRQVLPAEIKIWKALAIDETATGTINIPFGIDRIVYDTKTDTDFGGTGQTFDWNLPLPTKNQALLAGGLSLQNVTSALQQGFFGLDFNSGLELSPGVKAPQLIEQVFSQIRHY